MKTPLRSLTASALLLVLGTKRKVGEKVVFRLTETVAISVAKP